MKSLAAVFVGPDKPLELRSFSLPTLNAGEALIEIDCCTLCGSDLHTLAGRRPSHGATILGHEAIGRVRALPDRPPVIVDSDNRALQIGDRVTWSIVAACGDCYFCQNGLTQKCLNKTKFGHEPVSNDGPLFGGLSTHCVLLPGTTIVTLPAVLPDHVACPANCAAATVMAAFRTAGASCEGRRVLVIGAGMLGLTAAAVATHRKACSVTVSDPQASRRAWAHRFGATVTLDAAMGCESEAEFDMAFEMSGSPGAIENAVSMLRIGGKLVLVGSVFTTRNISVSPELLVRRMLRIEGVHNYSGRDLVEAVSFLAATWRRFPFEELVEAEYPLNSVNQAVNDAMARPQIRIAVRP